MLASKESELTPKRVPNWWLPVTFFRMEKERKLSTLPSKDSQQEDRHGLGSTLFFSSAAEVFSKTLLQSEPVRANGVPGVVNSVPLWFPVGPAG